jgi:hypothetical protein
MADMPQRIGRLFIPERWVNILGRTFAQREHTPVLRIGTRTWDRWHLGRLGCPHPVAAATLNRVVTELRITTLAGLADQIQTIGLYRGVGTTAYALALAVLREGGFDLNAVHANDVTYITLKQRARKTIAQQQLRKRRPRRAGPPSEQKDATT